MDYSISSLIARRPAKAERRTEGLREVKSVGAMIEGVVKGILRGGGREGGGQRDGGS